jgi:sterol desaturase/sphingolipid hydroxylase (fatty acid hydroxylase superfamily)
MCIRTARNASRAAAAHHTPMAASAIRALSARSEAHRRHHASDKEAIDKNYAIHFPWIDKLFGTHFSPKGRWPERYGLDGEKISPTFVGQTIGRRSVG